jgi:hypothetical protein
MCGLYSPRMDAAGPSNRTIAALLLAALAAVLLAWGAARGVQARWLGTPPVPRTPGVLALGDAQLAYRTTGLMLQNMGDMGGRTTPLKDYDYDALGRWFATADTLDPRSNFVPYLAAFYFGGTQNPAQLPPVIDYLARVGARPGPVKWRWLAQAVFLARYRMQDMARATALARELSALAAERGDLPIWARNMEAMVRAAAGEKQAARAMLLALLAQSGDEMDPTEVNATLAYICERLMEPAEAAAADMCAGLPPPGGG